MRTSYTHLLYASAHASRHDTLAHTHARTHAFLRLALGPADDWVAIHSYNECTQRKHSSVKCQSRWLVAMQCSLHLLRGRDRLEQNRRPTVMAPVVCRYTTLKFASAAHKLSTSRSSEQIFGRWQVQVTFDNKMLSHLRKSASISQRPEE